MVALRCGIFAYREGNGIRPWRRQPSGMSLPAFNCSFARRKRLHAHQAIQVPTWPGRGLRITVAVEARISVRSVDLRRKAGDSATQLSWAVPPFTEDGTGSVVLVEDDDARGLVRCSGGA